MLSFLARTPRLCTNLVLISRCLFGVSRKPLAVRLHCAVIGTFFSLKLDQWQNGKETWEKLERFVHNGSGFSVEATKYILVFFHQSIPAYVFVTDTFAVILSTSLILCSTLSNQGALDDVLCKFLQR